MITFNISQTKIYIIITLIAFSEIHGFKRSSQIKLKIHIKGLNTWQMLKVKLVRTMNRLIMKTRYYKNYPGAGKYLSFFYKLKTDKMNIE